MTKRKGKSLQKGVLQILLLRTWITFQKEISQHNEKILSTKITYITKM